MQIRKPTTPQPQRLRSSNLRSVPRGSYVGHGTISMADICDDRSAHSRRNSAVYSVTSRRNSAQSSRRNSAQLSRRNSAEQDRRRLSVPDSRDQSRSGSPEPGMRSGGLASIVSKTATKRKSVARIYISDPDGRKDVDYHKQGKLSSGWQTRYSKVNDRVSALFNCWTMSDVIFQVGDRQIPGHKFVLSSASPVLASECSQSNRLQLGNFLGQHFGQQFGQSAMSASGTCTPNSDGKSSKTNRTSRRDKNESQHNTANHVRIVIDGYPFDAFFEFIKYIYTDNAMINLNNVKHLIFLADDYKVYHLSSICFQFLRSGITGESVLRVLEVMRSLLTRACVRLWKEVIEKNRALVRFQELNMVERRATLQAINMASSSRPSSRGSSRKTTTDLSRISARKDSIASSDSGLSSKTGSAYNSRFDAAEDEYGDLGDEELMGRTTPKDSRQKSHQLYLQTVHMSEELNAKCWKCVSECTEAVLGCSVWTSQPLNIVKEILRLEVVNVSEIELFRGLIEWADKRCRDQGLAILPENRLKVMGNDALQLVRFPRMSLEHIQWEVVPTGVLDFKDLETLQNIMCNRTSTVGRFNGEPRQPPITAMFNQNRRVSSPKLAKAGFADDFGDAPGEKRPRSTTPVYHAAMNDEIDALLASQLLRFHVDRFVDDHAINLAAAEAGVPVGAVSNEAEAPRVVLMEDPGDIGGRDAQRAGQQVARQLMPMLMHTQNWLVQEQMEETQADRQGTESPTAAGPRTPNEVAYTTWGDAPGPQDFKRVGRGLYSFRGNRILEMAIEGGEAVVYEREDEDLDDEDFGEDLEGMTEEAIRREYGLANEERKHRVPLNAFLCRQ